MLTPERDNHFLQFLIDARHISRPNGGEPFEFRLADGLLFETFQAAVQAAWSAREFPLVHELMLRYNLVDVVCYRCAARPLSGSAPPQTDPLFYKLCNACIWQSTRDGTIKQVWWPRE